MKTKVKKLQKGQEAVITGEVRVHPRKKEGSDEPWILLRIADNSGMASATIWQELEIYPAIAELTDGDLVEAQVLCTEDSNFVNVEIKTITKIERKSGQRVDVTELKNELRTAIGEIKDPQLKKLVCSVIGRPDINEAYFKAPATTMSGYCFEGGVVASVVRLIRLVKMISSVFNEWNHNIDNFFVKLNTDLLVTASILEPVGKVRSYVMNGRKVERTVQGELLGDSYMALKVVLEEFGKAGLSEDQQMNLEHVLGSVYGRKEWHATFTPRSREAVAFNLIWDLNLQMGHYEELERNASVTDLFAKLFQKQVYLGSYDE